MIPEESKGSYTSLVLEDQVIHHIGPSKKNVPNAVSLIEMHQLGRSGIQCGGGGGLPPAATIDIPKLNSAKHINMSQLNIPKKGRRFLDV